MVLNEAWRRRVDVVLVAGFLFASAHVLFSSTDVALAIDGRQCRPGAATFLLADPLVSDSLQEGLSLYGFSCDEETAER